MVTQIDTHKSWMKEATESADPDPVLALTKSDIAIIAAVPLFLFSLYFVAVYPSILLSASIVSLVVILIWGGRQLRLFFHRGVPNESESLMNFSPLGALTCICEDSRPGLTHRAERRATCRTCGHAVVQRDAGRLTAELSPKEIQQIAAKLRDAAKDAAGMAIPSSVESIDQLVDYLYTAPPAPPSNDPPATAPNRQLI